MSCATLFVSSSPISPSSQSRNSNTCPLSPTTTFSSSASDSVQSLTISLAMSGAFHQSLQEQILQGATLKLLEKKTSDSITPTKEQKQKLATSSTTREETSIPKGEASYYIREARRSEIKQIIDALMDSFHHGSQPAYDSYIRRYKYNHLLTCFDAIDECDRGLFVACAVPSSPSVHSSKHENDEKDYEATEQIVGFCSVDGRTPDPSCKIEFLTPSTLASTSPRPYLSDLGVCVAHRRRGLGEKLVQACERWTRQRGYDKLYLKVEKKNAGGVGLYSTLGYTKTKLPWGKNAVSVNGGRWDMTVLMEKSVMKDVDSMQNENNRNKRRKRTWIKNQLWKPLKESVDKYAVRVNNDCPPL
eukprot:CAMPEP_0183715068 /NCGR_PEP_ID=MMETSP0737-20130205/9433_1 /TAXON_ID=385413 /ORGANISM="Thalassiosira miniscula, Strain CCMP1093" /LENGTH=358 /DNA_ID=CAMNT_0025944129 /DNA_START=8 /DNA_END=1084 /DNA_ORIENTATION=+